MPGRYGPAVRDRPDPRQLVLLPAATAESVPSGPPRRGGDGLLLLAAIVGGALFFTSLGTIWPLARTDLTRPAAALQAHARSFLTQRGQAVDRFDAATWIGTDDKALDYVEEVFGKERAQRFIADGFPIVSYHVSLKQAGNPDALWVTLHPSGTVLGWGREIQEDAPGSRLGEDQARELLRRELHEGLGLDLSAWTEKAVSARELPARRDHTFVYERALSEAPELRERAWGSVAGDEVSSVSRALIVPGAARRAGIAKQAPGDALESVGIALLAVGAVGAFVVFLRRLRSGSVRLGRAATWIAVLAVTQLATQALRTASLFSGWEPLWPRWISTLRSLVLDSAGSAWTLLVLLAFIAAGEALDREAGAGRGASLWALGRGRLGDPAVARASWRGFLIGLACGGLLAASVLALESVAGARTAIQPRGFFFYALNSASPSLSTLLFFLNVALAEELGYRFFGATWLFGLTRSRLVAIGVPALIYGLTHSTLDFLPPVEPFWARPLVMTVVGAFWGWAFFRWDALTVVLSHYTADLFIFNWPRLGSGQLLPTATAFAVICVPLVPALWGGIGALRAARRSGGSGGPADRRALSP